MSSYTLSSITCYSLCRWGVLFLQLLCAVVSLSTDGRRIVRRFIEGGGGGGCSGGNGVAKCATKHK